MTSKSCNHHTPCVFIAISIISVSMVLGSHSQDSRILPTGDSLGLFHCVNREIEVERRSDPPNSGLREVWANRRSGLYRIQDIGKLPKKDADDIIIATPTDNWIYSSLTRKGYHLRTSDSGKQDVTLNLFSLSEPREVWSLELEREFEFFVNHSATKGSQVMIDSIRCDVYKVQLGGTQLVLYVRKDNNEPLQVSIQSALNRFSVRFELREVLNECSDSLFVPPGDISFQEVRH